MDQFIQLAVWASPQRPCQVGCAWRIGSSLATLAALCLAPSALQASKNQKIKYLSESRRPSPNFHPTPMVYSSLSMFIIIVPYFLNENYLFAGGISVAKVHQRSGGTRRVPAAFAARPGSTMSTLAPQNSCRKGIYIPKFQVFLGFLKTSQLPGWFSSRVSNEFPSELGRSRQVETRHGHPRVSWSTGIDMVDVTWCDLGELTIHFWLVNYSSIISILRHQFIFSN